MKRDVVLASVAAIAVACLLPCSAKEAGKAESGLKPSDKQFIHNSAIAGMTEVKLAEVAEGHASDQKVKDFAKKLVADHTKANESLAKVASEKGVTVPSDVDAKHKALIDKLSKLKGAKFDEEYIDQMIVDHKKVAADLTAESRSGEAALKEWCEKTLPTVKEHLQMAKDIDKAIDAPKAK